MFSFLKEKLKSALSTFSKKAEEEAPEEVVEEKKSPPPKKSPAKKEAPKKKEEPKKKEATPKKAHEKKEPEKKESEPKGAPQKEPIRKEHSLKREERLIEEKKPVKEHDHNETEERGKEPELHPEEEPQPASSNQPSKKPGFFARLFGKKEEEKAPEPSHEEAAKAIEEVKEEIISEEDVEIAEETTAEEREEAPTLEEVEEQQAEEAESEEVPAEEEQEDIEKEEPTGEEEPEQPTRTAPEPAAAIEEEATGFFARLTQKIVTKRITLEQFEELFFDLELAMLENNVAVEVIEKIKADLREQIVDKPIKRGKVEETILVVLKESIQGLFTTPSLNLLDFVKKKKPTVICLVGINGSGKTTTIAKIAKLLQDNGLDPVIAAADTFRAAAIDQLEEHGERLGVKVIKHDYGSDAAAVAFDAIKHAESKGKDVVLVDTAGRMHSNANLMDEMKKIIRVAKPDLKIFIGESIAGNDCVEQAKAFNDAIGIDGIILSKADVDEKGGAAISVSYVTGKPILYIGVGQEYKDLKPFSPKLVMESLGL